MTATANHPADDGNGAKAADVSAEAYAERLFSSCLGAFETLSVYVGDRLGWYRALSAEGPATAAELAERTGTQTRYCQEWLQMQASFGTVTVELGTDRASDRFILPPGPGEVLTNERSLSFLSPMPQMIAAVGPRLPDLLRAYRAGGGVSWAEFGDDARDAQDAINRPWFETRLGVALDNVEEVGVVLNRAGAVIADIGCGTGWSTVALARQYPQARLLGLDIDPPSVDQARARAAAAGVADRISFQLAEGETLEPNSVDAAFVLEALHDMPRPVEVLTAIRRAVRPDGLVVIMDEAVADAFTGPGDEIDRIMYGYSLFICLPDGMSSTPSAATGTVFRRPTLESYAVDAGFERVSVLPIDDFAFFRFYRLHL